MALIEVNFYSDSLERTVTLNAIVPTDKTMFAESHRAPKRGPFKTLYLLHGGYGNYTDWVGGTRIQMWAQDRDLAVIMPSGDNSWYIDREEALGGRWGQFIGEELIDFTRTTFPLSTDREDTFIAGLSMGGYGATVNGFRWNDVFGRIGAFSPGYVIEDIVSEYDLGSPIEPIESVMGPNSRQTIALGFGDADAVRGSDRDYIHLVKALKASKAAMPGLFLSVGTEDFLLQRVRRFHDFLEQEGVEHTYEESVGGHEWNFWDYTIKRFLDWLPLDEDAVAGKNSGNTRASATA